VRGGGEEVVKEGRLEMTGVVCDERRRRCYVSLRESAAWGPYKGESSNGEDISV